MAIPVPREMQCELLPPRIALPDSFLARAALAIAGMAALAVFAVAVTYAAVVLGILGMTQVVS